ncbi:hypothetical protein U9M48_014872 [Paspalum notatum var. saurae]|uniref:Uncharacterized protein n=1 Tax=Paspalum notatum var. saurae TaxID=547442 RepID=A0AAQ3T430_PASNO
MTARHHPRTPSPAIPVPGPTLRPQPTSVTCPLARRIRHITSPPTRRHRHDSPLATQVLCADIDSAPHGSIASRVPYRDAAAALVPPSRLRCRTSPSRRHPHASVASRVAPLRRPHMRQAQHLSWTKRTGVQSRISGMATLLHMSAGAVRAAARHVIHVFSWDCSRLPTPLPSHGLPK